MIGHAPSRNSKEALMGDSSNPVQSIPDDSVHRRPDDWKVLAARGMTAALVPTPVDDLEERSRAAAWRVAQTRCRADPLTRMCWGDMDAIVAAVLGQVRGDSMPPLPPDPPAWTDCAACNGRGVEA